MNAEEFDLISRDRIVHASLSLGDESGSERFFGAKSYGFPTICRFYQDNLKITDYRTDKELICIAYDAIDEIEFSVCSRLAGFKVVPYFIFYGRLIIARKDSRKFVIEFKLSKLLPDISMLLTSRHVKITDRIGIVEAAKDYDEERIYKFIEENIKDWSARYGVDNPQTDDLITRN